MPDKELILQSLLNKRNLLFLLSESSGLGIKIALGMGGVQRAVYQDALILGGGAQAFSNRRRVTAAKQALCRPRA